MKKPTLSITAACLAMTPAFGYSKEVSISDCEELLRAVVVTWSSLQSVEVTVDFEGEYFPAFLEHREKIGYPLTIKDPRSEGTAVYFAQGENYGYKLKQTWGNGSLMRNEEGAWDGAQWQRLNRYPATGAQLEVSKIRTGSYEATSKYGSPFEYAFPFLKNFPAGGDISEDGWIYGINLDRISNEQEWLAAIASADRVVETSEVDGVEMLVLTFDRGFLGGDRTTKARYRVWLDRENPAFPVRVQTLDRKSGKIVSEFKAEEFLQKGGFRFPSEYTVVDFDCNEPSEYGNLPYSEQRFTVRDIKVDEKFNAQKFAFDASSARSVVDLVSGRTVRVKK